MRNQATVTALSWIPSDSLKGALKTGMDLRLSHWDQPLPRELPRDDVVAHVHEMCREDRFRFGQVLQGWAEVEDGRIAAAGFEDVSGLVMGATTVRVGAVGATFRAASLPVIRHDPVIEGDRVRLVQTVGGRTGVPLPRPVPHPPYVRWQAPLVWTTLALTMYADGRTEVELAGASAFPRHWVYDADGRLALKSGLADQQRWMAHSFGERTPWSDHDRAAIVAGVETELETQLSTTVMRGGARPVIHELPEGTVLMKQGERDDKLYLVLDGVVRVDVAGHGQVAEVGPGALIGERALIEDGVRTSTVTAVTPVRLAVADRGSIDLDRLRTLAEGHRREELVEAE